jgi:hypothetical protein
MKSKGATDFHNINNKIYVNSEGSEACQSGAKNKCVLF